MAGTLVTAARKMIYLAGTQFRAAVSEELIQRLGAGINFINLYQHSEKQFFLNGPYSIVAPPQTGVDGLVVFEYDAEIIGVHMFNLTAGSGGTTELDVKRQTTSGGAFSTIFSTTPKITSAAGNNARIAIGGSGVGLTAPVLSVTEVDAGDALRMDILQAQTGGQNTGIIIHYRPR